MFRKIGSQHTRESLENTDTVEESMETPSVIHWETRTWHTPRASDPHCFQPGTCKVPGVSPYILPHGAEFLDSLLTQVSFSILADCCMGRHGMYLLWHFTPATGYSSKFTYGQNEALIIHLPSPEPKVINSGTQQSLFSQSCMLTWSQGLLSSLSGGRMRL